MSMTESKGLTRPARWMAVSSTASAFIGKTLKWKARSGTDNQYGDVVERSQCRGALFALERFFVAALYGLDGHLGHNSDLNGPSSFCVAIGSLGRPMREKLDLKVIEVELLAYLATVKLLRDETGDSLVALTRNSLERLKAYLDVLNEQACRDHEGMVTANTKWP